jgi:hypothetical protein
VGDLSQAREFALSLPGTAEGPHFDMTSFRVRGKIFATATADETRLHVFVDESEVAATVAEHAATEHTGAQHTGAQHTGAQHTGAQHTGAQKPVAFEPLLWGERVRGLRITLAAAPDDRVRELLTEAWRRKAGPRLAAQFDAAGGRWR